MSDSAAPHVPLPAAAAPPVTLCHPARSWVATMNKAGSQYGGRVKDVVVAKQGSHSAFSDALQLLKAMGGHIWQRCLRPSEGAV